MTTTALLFIFASKQVWLTLGFVYNLGISLHSWTYFKDVPCSQKSSQKLTWEVQCIHYYCWYVAKAIFFSLP